MTAPATRYARADDRASIADQVLGDGLDLVYVPGFFSHVDFAWERPASARFLHRLASFSRLIVMDKRGRGSPTRSAAWISPRSARTTFAPSWMRPDPTARHSSDRSREERSRCSVQRETPTASTASRSTPRPLQVAQGPDYPHGWSPAAIQLYLAGLGRRLGRRGRRVGARPEPRRRRRLQPVVRSPAERWQRVPAWHMTLLELERAAGRAQRSRRPRPPGAHPASNRRPPRRSPALPLSRRARDWVAHPRARGRRSLAVGRRRRRPRVRAVGARHGRSGGATPRPRARNASLHRRRRIDRVASEVGDRRLSEFLDDHRAVMRRELVRFGGREIDSTGDGFLASFDGPTLAIRCAVAAQEAVRPLGLELRAGVHTGECEVLGSRLGGIHVHLGSRVASTAGPGEIVVSSTVRELVEGSAITFEHRGAFALKGVRGDRDLFTARLSTTAHVP